MSFEYDRVEGVTEEEFRKHARPVEELRADPTYKTTSPEELAEIERILDVQTGFLSDAEFFTQVASCGGYGRELGFKDVVTTALIDAKHSKSAVLHTLVGNKYFVSPARPIRCSECGTKRVRLLVCDGELRLHSCDDANVGPAEVVRGNLAPELAAELAEWHTAQ